SEEIRICGKEWWIDLAGGIVPCRRSDESVGRYIAVVVVSDSHTNHNVTRIEFGIDSACRSRENDSRWGKVVQQKRGCEGRAHSADRGSNNDNASPVDDAGSELDTLDSAKCCAFEPSFNRRDLTWNSNNRKQPVRRLLCGRRRPTSNQRERDDKRNS